MGLRTEVYPAAITNNANNYSILFNNFHISIVVNFSPVILLTVIFLLLQLQCHNPVALQLIGLMTCCKVKALQSNGFNLWNF